MEYSLRCPRCGKRHAYYSHEIGGTAECAGCKEPLKLRANPGALIRYLIWPVLVSLALIVFFVARLLRRLGGRE